MTLEVNKELCTGCGTCAEVCANYVLHIDAGKSVAKYPDQCCDCGHCVSMCSTGAINHEKYPKESMKNLAVPSISQADLKNLMLSRRSIRIFTDYVPSKEDIENLIEVGVHAGTSSNGQTEGFIIMKDSQKRDKIETLVIDELWNAGLKLLGGNQDSLKAKLMYKILLKKYGAEMIGQYYSYHGIIKHRMENTI